MSGPDPSGNPPKGGSKGKQNDAAGSSTGRRGQKPELPINAANVVHKTACVNWLTDKGCRYAERCRFVHTVLDSKDGRCFNCSGKGHSKRECAAGKRSESREPKGGSVGEGDAGAPESVEGGLDEAETAAQITPENEEVIQEVNHLLKSITGPMPKTIGKRAECGPCEAKTVKVTPKNSINPGPERAAQAVQEVNHHMKGIAGPMLKSLGNGGDPEVEDTGLLDGGATHPPTTGYQRRDQECSAGHCGVSSRSRAALPKSHEWNTSIGRSGGTYSSSQRTCGIGIHHHMVPCRMCRETPKTGKNQMLGAVWVSSGPKGSRPGSYHRDRAHGHGKEERPTFHAGRSE